MLDVRRLAGLAVLAAILAMPSGGMASRCNNDALCRACFDQTLVVPPDGVPACDDAQDLIDERTSAVTPFTLTYESCASQAGGTGRQQAGKCRAIVARLNRCAQTREDDTAPIWSDFNRKVKRCSRALYQTAERFRRKCLRSRKCLCNGVPVTTSTTTTSTSTTDTNATTTTTTTSTSTTVAPTTTTLVIGASTSTTVTMTTSTTSTTRGNPLPINPTGSDCQQQCIATVAKDCFDDCRSSCGTARNALPFCQRTCRNFQCEQLTTLCTGSGVDFDNPKPQDRNQAYFTCCRQSGDCEDDDEESLACRTPPETPTASTTTTLTGARPTTTTLSGTVF